MKIILLGYGKMGRTIEKVAINRGHEISARIDIDNQNELDEAQGDVVIEFSHPDSAFNNITKCLLRKLPIVSGTTGWLDRRSEVIDLCSQVDGTFFYASNYSLGVNLFFKVNEYLARIMNDFPEYEIEMDEIHHSEKKDAPSGTAISLAEGIIKNVARKKNWVSKKTIKADEIYIGSFRIDQVPGTHIVKYASPIDDIEIKHTAHSRDGFALGAVLVAEWAQNKKGVLSMDDFLKF